VQPKVDVPIDAGGAKVLVVKFNDYQCPPCRQTYLDYKGLLARYTATGQVKFVLKHFPLEGECNPQVAGGTHTAACEAASAVLMAHGKGTADKFEEWLFANQPSLTSASVRGAASSVAGIGDFEAQYSRTLDQVRADAALGEKLEVKSTPTFFINGRRIAGGLPTSYFELAIEHELKR
jgi:protein-disulfide isomerase